MLWYAMYILLFLEIFGQTYKTFRIVDSIGIQLWCWGTGARGKSRIWATKQIVYIFLQLYIITDCTIHITTIHTHTHLCLSCILHDSSPKISSVDANQVNANPSYLPVFPGSGCDGRAHFFDLPLPQLALLTSFWLRIFLLASRATWVSKQHL